MPRHLVEQARLSVPPVVDVYDRDGELGHGARRLQQLLRHRVGPHVHLRPRDRRAPAERPRGRAPRRPPLRCAAEPGLRHELGPSHRREPPSRVPAELPGDDGEQHQAAGHDRRERRRPRRDDRHRPRAARRGRASCARSPTSWSTTSRSALSCIPWTAWTSCCCAPTRACPRSTRRRRSPAPRRPITVAGHTAQGVAECLFGLVIHQLRRPGAPFLFGIGSAVLDIATAQSSYNDLGYLTGYMCAVEMAKWLDIPNWGNAGTSDSHAARRAGRHGGHADHVPRHAGRLQPGPRRRVSRLRAHVLARGDRGRRRVHRHEQAPSRRRPGGSREPCRRDDRPGRPGRPLHGRASTRAATCARSSGGPAS